MHANPRTPHRRTAIVLAGGGARGAYEAGVLSYLFERIYARVGPNFEFDVVSGTSVGATHAAFTVASSHMEPEARARLLTETWTEMRIRNVLSISTRDLFAVPLRALGLTRLTRISGAERAESVGGLVDLTPLGDLVTHRVPWTEMRANLNERHRGALCVSCTEVRSGRVTVFMDGPLADPEPWSHDPNAQAIRTEITHQHVRASAAIPFLFPSVRIDRRYYVDGGLRMNTPLSPALRLSAERILVIALKHKPPLSASALPYPEEVITQPAFLLGKVLDALTLDQLEYELHRIGLINALIDRGEAVYGEDFLDRMNVAVKEQRGVGFRPVATAVVRPSEDIGRMAADCHSRTGGFRELGVLPGLLARMAQHGLPGGEADLLSYLYFDGCFTSQLVELGRQDARAMEDEILELLAG
ncbi:MAG: patatin-like phospholipase family protein [Myxococcales bacterium]|nr:patatin-like phospholipase family protein [Myxococcales bacterium]MDH5566615.1 patatin-like phospholipase family protein [Myxococcales bacterium]